MSGPCKCIRTLHLSAFGWNNISGSFCFSCWAFQINWKRVITSPGWWHCLNSANCLMQLLWLMKVFCASKSRFNVVFRHQSFSARDNKPAQMFSWLFIPFIYMLKPLINWLCPDADSQELEKAAPLPLILLKDTENALYALDCIYAFKYCIRNSVVQRRFQPKCREDWKCFSSAVSGPWTAPWYFYPISIVPRLRLMFQCHGQILMETNLSQIMDQ